MSYLHSLSDTNGKLPLDTVKLSYDAAHAEVWVVSGGVARVFNASGMELFSFGHNPELGSLARWSGSRTATSPSSR